MASRCTECQTKLLCLATLAPHAAHWTHLYRSLIFDQCWCDLSHTLDGETQSILAILLFSSHRTINIKEHGCNVSSLSLASHTGTHIDAPYHFFEDKKTVDELDLSLLVGPAAVADLTSKGARERISGMTSSAQTSSLSSRTATFCLHWKTPKYLDHPFIDREAAKKLVEMGVRVLGVDTMSPDETIVDGSESDFGVHETILGAGAMIVENLTGLDKLPTVCCFTYNKSGWQLQPLDGLANLQNLRDLTTGLILPYIQFRFTAILQNNSAKTKIRKIAAPVEVPLFACLHCSCDGSPIRAVAWFPENEK
ncbi:hypothetical protein DFH11DRAFT_1746428 [Phellopilus nigrolimitatus]|nr:hypothetical protein DFH11DRAFT_1746428 [Phellopilus nigrolimitatus]